jgi:hypothetical protein
MNENNIRQLMERFLNAETTLQEEQVLYVYFQSEDVADDLKPYREAFQSFAAVKGIDKPVAKSTPAWVVALRTVMSVAAAFFIGLFLLVNEDTPEATLLTTATKQTEFMPNLCEGSTARELYMCYMERKREQPSTYNLIKRMIYENEH